MSSLEHAVQVPASGPSGDGFEAGAEPARTAALIARRSAFTGRVTYVDPQGVRALRRRVPRPILASASLMAVALGMLFATTGSSPAPSGSPGLEQPAAVEFQVLDGPASGETLHR